MPIWNQLRREPMLHKGKLTHHIPVDIANDYSTERKTIKYYIHIKN